MRPQEIFLIVSFIFLLFNVSILYRVYSYYRDNSYLKYMIVYLILAIFWVSGIGIFGRTDKMFRLSIGLFFTSPQILVYFMFIFIDKYLVSRKTGVYKILNWLAFTTFASGIAMSLYLQLNIASIFSIVRNNSITRIDILNTYFYSIYSNYFTIMTILTLFLIFFKYLETRSIFIGWICG